MSKKVFISSVLLFAYSLVQVHNIIPHFHYNEVSEFTHNHDHHHDHHYDKQESKQDNENDDPIGFFSHLTHLATTKELSYELSTSLNFNKIQSIEHFITKECLVLKELIILIRPGPTIEFVLKVKQIIFSTHILRGPPVDSV